MFHFSPRKADCAYKRYGLAPTAVRATAMGRTAILHPLATALHALALGLPPLAAILAALSALLQMCSGSFVAVLFKPLAAILHPFALILEPLAARLAMLPALLKMLSAAFRALAWEQGVPSVMMAVTDIRIPVVPVPVQSAHIRLALLLVLLELVNIFVQLCFVAALQVLTDLLLVLANLPSILPDLVKVTADLGGLRVVRQLFGEMGMLLKVYMPIVKWCRLWRCRLLCHDEVGEADGKGHTILHRHVPPAQEAIRQRPAPTVAKPFRSFRIQDPLNQHIRKEAQRIPIAPVVNRQPMALQQLADASLGIAPLVPQHPVPLPVQGRKRGGCDHHSPAVHEDLGYLLDDPGIVFDVIERVEADHRIKLRITDGLEQMRQIPQTGNVPIDAVFARIAVGELNAFGVGVEPCHVEPFQDQIHRQLSGQTPDI